jgi:4a-hydroxytetrahydrobiopterin dehydratase
MATELLDEASIETAMAALTGWERDGDKLRREFTFDDFTQAFGFMASVALIAERLFHHPEWSNVWNRVTIEITNHDAGGITELDFEFAAKVNALL